MEEKVLSAINDLKELTKKDFITAELITFEKICLTGLNKEEVALAVKEVFPEIKRIPSPPHEINWFLNGRLLVATNTGQDSWKFNWDWTSVGL
jgi:hypothetical protein